MNLYRKGVSLTDVYEVVADYAQWAVVENTVTIIENAIHEMGRWKLWVSFTKSFHPHPVYDTKQAITQGS